MTLVWTLILLLLLCGAGALYAGLRGKRVNDHPICRKCGFDLVGVHAPLKSESPSEVAQLSELCAERQSSGNPKQTRPAPADTASAAAGDANTIEPATHSSESCATTSRCPECGRDLNAKRAVRIGARRKRTLALSSGVLLLLLTLSLGGAWGWGRASSFNWNTVKPVWMLRLEADGVDNATADAALRELLARATRGELSDQVGRELAERGLARQRDLNQTWRPQWGSLVEWAHRSKLVSDEEFELYVRTMITMWLSSDWSAAPAEIALHKRGRPRSVAFVGYKPFLSYSLSGSRGASASDLFCRPELEQLFIDGRTVEAVTTMHHHTGLVGGSGFSNLSLTLPSPLPAGVHDIAATWRIRVFHDSVIHRGSWGNAMSARDLKSGEPIDLPEGFLNRESRPVGDFVITIKSQISVEPPRQAHAVHLVRDAELEPIIRNAIEIRFEDVRREGAFVHFVLRRSVDPIPIAISFDLFVRDGDREWPSISLQAKAGEPVKAAELRILTEVSEFGVTSDTVDLILRPNPTAVERKEGFEAIWGDEIILRNIPIGWAEELVPIEATTPP